MFISKNRKKSELLNNCIKNSKLKKDYLLLEKEYIQKYNKIVNADYGGKIENLPANAYTHRPYSD